MPIELTQTEKLLDKYLSMTEITPEDAGLLCTFLPDELDQLDFLEWLMDNLGATTSDMLKKVVQIRTADLPAAPTE